MRRNINRALHALMAALGALAIGAMLTPSAIAGCGDMPGKPGNPQRTTFTPVTYRVVSQSGLSDNPGPGGADIVGMWKFSFLSKNNPRIPDDTVLDWGFTQW